jgi:methionine-rich copper-binding protein CopC
MKRVIFALLLIIVADSARVEAHAFLQRAEPAVGGTVQTSPAEVRIWFSERIKPGLGAIRVFNSTGREMDKRDARVDRSKQALVRVSLPRLQAGTYKVVWRVVSVDSHATKGSFTFRVIR